MKTILKILAVIIAILVLLGISGVLLAAYGYIELPFQLPFLDEKPEVVIEKFYERAGTMQSGHGEGETRIRAELKKIGFNLFTAGLKETGLNKEANPAIGEPVSLVFRSKDDWKNNPEENRTQSNINWTLEWGGLALTLDVDIKVVDKTLYIKINKMPLSPFLAALAGEPITGVWFTLDPDRLKTFLKNIHAAKSAEHLSIASEDMIEKFRAFALAHKNSIAVEKLQGEKISGKATYHYRVNFNNDNMKAALIDAVDLFLDIYINTYLSSINMKPSKEEIEEGKQTWREFLDENYESKIQPHLDAMDIELWIEKRDYYPYQWRFSYALPSEAISTGDNEFSKTLNQFISALTVESFYTLSSINAETTIEPPSDAKDIVALIVALEEKQMKQPRQRARDAKRAADLRQLKTMAELEAAGSADDLYPVQKSWNESPEGWKYIMPPNNEKFSADYCYYVHTNRHAYILSTRVEQNNSYSYSEATNKLVDLDLSKSDFTLMSSGLAEKTDCVNPKGPDPILHCGTKNRYCLMGANADGEEILKTIAVGSETDLTKKDSDSDGLSDADEIKYGANPKDDDSDDDGYLDGEEVENGYNPLGEGKLSKMQPF